MTSIQEIRFSVKQICLAHRQQLNSLNPQGESDTLHDSHFLLMPFQGGFITTRVLFIKLLAESCAATRAPSCCYNLSRKGAMTGRVNHNKKHGLDAEWPGAFSQKQQHRDSIGFAFLKG